MHRFTKGHPDVLTDSLTDHLYDIPAVVISLLVNEGIIEKGIQICDESSLNTLL